MKSDKMEKVEKKFENPACFVVNKRCGEEAQSIAGKGEFTVHRLDTPVSGCLLIARSREAAAFLGQAFARSGEAESPLKKRYWAVVENSGADKLPLNGDWVYLEHWLFFDKKLNKSFAQDREKSGSQKACLRCRLAGRGDRYLFLEIDLLTGRRHQIRAQLAALGLHIKGDLKYGARRSEKEGGIRLHARSLSFPNPLDPREIIHVEAEPPRFDALWEACSQNLVISARNAVSGSFQSCAFSP